MFDCLENFDLQSADSEGKHWQTALENFHSATQECDADMEKACSMRTRKRHQSAQSWEETENYPSEGRMEKLVRAFEEKENHFDCPKETNGISKTMHRFFHEYMAGKGG